jgi:hypothetical protein
MKRNEKEVLNRTQLHKSDRNSLFGADRTLSMMIVNAIPPEPRHEIPASGVTELMTCSPSQVLLNAGLCRHHMQHCYTVVGRRIPFRGAEIAENSILASSVQV